jgi:sortase A
MTATPTALAVLPDSMAAASRSMTMSEAPAIPAAPPPASAPPSRLVIPRLNLEAPVEPVGLVPSTVAPGVLEWDVPGYRAAGWLNTSAPLGRPGNTVLDGHHNVHGEVFRDLWTLQAGDAITVSAAGEARQYRVSEVLILPERDQPLETRLANARYIQPTEDERLTLVTCWPYEDNSHRTVVVAFPGE